MIRREIKNQVIWTAAPRVEIYKIGEAFQFLETIRFISFRED